MLADQNLTRWCGAMRSAHVAAEAGDIADAVHLYHLASHEAEQLLLHRCEDLPAAQMFATSWQALADCYRRLEREDLAFWAVRQAHKRLLEVVEDGCLPAEFRQDCLKELNHSLLPLLAMLKTTPEGAVEAQRLINQTRALGARVLALVPSRQRSQRVAH